jgi:hypothetical protein
MNRQKKTRSQKIILALSMLSLGVLAAVPWASVNGQEGIDGADLPRSGLLLEGIWTTMMDGNSLCSLVVTAQGSEGLIYTVVGKHPQCPPSQGGFFPEANRVGDILGHFKRTGANTFRLSVIFHGIKDNAAGGLGEIIYMIVMNGTGEIIDEDTLVVHDFVGSAYVAAQDTNGDRLPDEGAEPVGCLPMGEVTFKRLPMFPACELAPMP